MCFDLLPLSARKWAPRPRVVANIGQLNDDCLFMILEHLPLNELIRVRVVCKKWQWMQLEICRRKQHLFIYVSSKYTIDHLSNHRYNIPINMFEFKKSCQLCTVALQNMSNSFVRVSSEYIELFNSYAANLFPNLKLLFIRFMYFETEYLCDLLEKFCPENSSNQIKCLTLLLPYHIERKGYLSWPDLSVYLSKSFKNLRHFTTSGSFPDTENVFSDFEEEPFDWSFLNQVTQLNLPNCSKLPLENVHLKEVSIFLNSAQSLGNFYRSLTFLDINFIEYNKMFCTETVSKLADMKSLIELRLHNYNSYYYGDHLSEFYNLPDLCRPQMIKFKSIQSLTLDFHFDPSFLPKLLDTLFPNLTNLNVTFINLKSYEWIDYLDDRLQNFTAWINGVFDKAPLYLSVSKRIDLNNNGSNVLRFDLTNCPYVRLEQYYTFAHRFAKDKGKLLDLTVKSEQKKRLCKTLRTRVKKKLLPANVFTVTRFSIRDPLILVNSRSLLESTAYYRVPSRQNRLDQLNQ